MTNPMTATTSMPPLPKGMQVFERGWLSANNILFTGDAGSLLIDSGYSSHSAQTLSLLEGALGSGPLETLVNTHLHSDHCGANAALQQRYPSLVTLIPPGQADLVRRWDAAALTYTPTGQQCPQFVFSDVLLPGSTMRFGAQDWEIHAAPGHDTHSLIFFEPQAGILISADALWEKGFGVVFPELEGEQAFADVAATLDIIARLKPKIVIPGHGKSFLYTDAIMALARKRLDGFVADPQRHALYAAKVLCKFKLLEVQLQRYADFAAWAEQATYFEQIRSKFFSHQPMTEWLSELCDNLVRSGAATRDAQYIRNQ
jgi:glyoxylase-like metal-dependent hydrolase (beta-lactamase superfamily II)